MLKFIKVIKIIYTDNLNREFIISKKIKSKNLNFLQKCIIYVNDYPSLIKKISKHLKGSNVDINYMNEKGWTTLMIACCNVKNKYMIDIIKLILKQNPDVNLKEYNGCTALMLLCNYEIDIYYSCRIVKLLLENDANINLQDIDGNSALLLSIKNYQYNKDDTLLIHYLIENNSDIDIQNNYGCNALIMTIKNIKDNAACYEIIYLLLNRGALVNIADNNGNTALIYATKNMNHNYEFWDKIVKLLIEYNADCTLKNNDGWNSFMYYCCITHPNPNESQRLKNDFLFYDTAKSILLNKDFILRMFKLYETKMININILEIILYYNINIKYLPIEDKDFKKALKKFTLQKKNVIFI